MKIQSHSLQGKRSSNEDQHVHLLNINSQNNNLNNINFVGVFDGHGVVTSIEIFKEKSSQIFY